MNAEVTVWFVQPDTILQQTVILQSPDGAVTWQGCSG